MNRGGPLGPRPKPRPRPKNTIYFRKLKRYKYQSMEGYSIETKLKGFQAELRFILLQPNGKLRIRTGYAWDGPSGPTIDTRSFMRGSLVHDALYQLMREGYLDLTCRKYADDLLRKLCLEDGMYRTRAWYVWRSCRRFGKKSAQPRKEPRDKIFEAP